MVSDICGVMHYGVGVVYNSRVEYVRRVEFSVGARGADGRRVFFFNDTAPTEIYTE